MIIFCEELKHYHYTGTGVCFFSECVVAIRLLALAVGQVRLSIAALTQKEVTFETVTKYSPVKQNWSLMFGWLLLPLK